MVKRSTAVFGLSDISNTSTSTSFISSNGRRLSSLSKRKSNLDLIDQENTRNLKSNLSFNFSSLIEKTSIKIDQEK
jgi:hypothetical protein